MKKILRSSLILAISLPLYLAIALMVLEVYLRASTRLAMTPGYVRTHPDRRYELRPLFRGKTYSAEVRINSAGLRDYERPVLDGAYRIAVFGDSITFGIGVELEKTFPKIVERALNQDPGGRPRAQVFNFGVPSYNTVHEYRYIRESYDAFRPDMIILEFTAQNDTAMTADLGAGINRYKAVRRLKDILRNLYSYDFLAARFYGMQYELLARRRHKDAYEARFFYDSLYYQDDYEGWAEAKKAFRGMKEYCDSKNIALIFVIFSNNIKLAPAPEEDLMYPIVKKGVEALREAGIGNIIVLDDTFRKYAGKEKLLWVMPMDPHFSCLAHALAAEEIVKYIYQKNLIRNKTADTYR